MSVYTQKHRLKQHVSHRGTHFKIIVSNPLEDSGKKQTFYVERKYMCISLCKFCIISTVKPKLQHIVCLINHVFNKAVDALQGRMCHLICSALTSTERKQLLALWMEAFKQCYLTSKLVLI